MTTLADTGRSKAEAGKFAPLKKVDAGLLNIGYAEAAPADDRGLILLHGWPYDIHSYIDVAQRTRQTRPCSLTASGRGMSCQAHEKSRALILAQAPARLATTEAQRPAAGESRRRAMRSDFSSAAAGLTRPVDKVISRRWSDLLWSA
jgi:hypothetical protein